MKILIIDNYDSFTYNLLHYVEGCGADSEVIRNDEYRRIDVLDYDKIILSPGPGLPSESKGLMEIIADVPKEMPVLGVCLGMQALAEYTGAFLYNLKEVRHGVETQVFQKNAHSLLRNLPNEFSVGCYHSWAVGQPLPDVWEELAISSEGILMAIAHKERPWFGVQFHPESILTPLGKKIIENFIRG
ncbi:MAG: aminodeoxychorismate/anthranilate synthase component II [Brumimicrobium sp.]|nr:aminodeoxychorismate/anthranilate synthase component II [Brumimicrobium sp.]